MGYEYTEETYNGHYLIRVLPKKLVRDIDEFAIDINSYTFSGRFILPVSLTPEDNEISIFYRHSGEKPIISESGKLCDISSEMLDNLVGSLIRIANFVLLGNIPLFPAYTLYDIFTYAGEFFFIPPYSFSNEQWQELMNNSNINKDYVFVDEEFLKTGIYEVQSSFNIIASLIEFFDKDGKYSELVQRLKNGKVEPSDLEKDAIDTNLLQDIIAEIESSKDKFNVVSIETSDSYRLFKDYIARIDKYFRNKKEPLIYIGTDFTNVIRQLLRKFPLELSDMELKDFAKCLYSFCKFDTIVEEILSFLKKFGNVKLVVKDLDNAHYLIRKFLGILENSDIKTTVLSFKASQPNIVFKVERLLTKVGEDSSIRNQIDSESALISVLGQRFSREDINIFSTILGKNGEELLEKLLTMGIVKSDDGEYVFNVDLKIIDDLVEESIKKSIHKRLAEEYKMQTSPDSLGLLKAARHYSFAEMEMAAVVMYLKFIRNALDSYFFSPTMVTSVFEVVYSMLEKHNKIGSYAFHRLRLEFEYRTGESLSNIAKLSDIDKMNNKRMYSYLRVIELFVEEKHLKCIEYADNLLKFADLSKFKYLNIALLKERANVAYYDKISDSAGIILETVIKTPVYNISWASLKSTWLWLFGTFYAYSNTKKAQEYLQQALSIASEYDLKYLLPNIYNTMGLTYDGTMLSILYFKEAIRISNEIGYVRKSVNPRLNLARELLYFGRFDELFGEMSRIDSTFKDYLSTSDLSYFYRLYGMIHTYLQMHDEGVEYFEKAFLIEDINKLPHSSLRGMILHELICGNFNKARELIQKYSDDPAIQIRAFEYLTKLAIVESDDEFLEIWLTYKNSDYSLLREEILYIFANRIYKVDKVGLLEELDKWDDFYGSQMTKLSLLYTLMAKLKYYQLSADVLREELVKHRIRRIVKELKIEGKFLQLEAHNYHFDDVALVEGLEVLKGIDSRISIPEFLRLFSNIIIDIFEPRIFFINVIDKRTNLDVSVGLKSESISSSFIKFTPLEASIKDRIDSESEYTIFFTSEKFIEVEKEAQEIVETINLLEELFSGQLRGLIFRERANRDPLTKLYNRWKFNEVFREYLEKANTKGTEVSIFIADIDNFKKINDSYGHLKGDEVLRGIAKILNDIILDQGVVARYGGEEFVGIFETDKHSCAKICDEIRQKISAESANLFGFTVTMSFGVASSKERKNNTELIGLADQRLYKAKESGKNRVCFE